MMNSKSIIIAIDPDVTQSGIATLYKHNKELTVGRFSFPELCDYLFSLKGNPNTLVVVEASWLISTNWHTGQMQSAATIAKIGARVGANHQVGKLIVEMSKYYDIEVRGQMPFKKDWKGAHGKISQKEIEAFIPSFPKRSNQEERDAALIAWVCAGFPIKINPLKR